MAVMKNKISIILGGAGFIGSQLIKFLLNENKKVIVIDNLCRGSIDFIESNEEVLFEKVNLDNLEDTSNCLRKIENKFEIDEIWHLAANSDIPAGIEDPNIDMRDTFMTTYNLLIAIKNINVNKIMFASSSAVYGDLGELLISENSAPLMPISNYGAMKLSSEAILSSHVEQNNTNLIIYRFPNVVGYPATHGVIFDFINKLIKTPDTLKVLGNGTQNKAYLHVKDLIEAMLFIRDTIDKKRLIINIGPPDKGITVKEIAEITRDFVSPNATIEFGQENKGWVGDVPKFYYDTSLLKSLGFKKVSSSKDAIKISVKEIFNQLRK